MFSTCTQKSMSTSTTSTGKRPSLEHQDNGNVRTYSDDPLRARSGHRLPRGLRRETRGTNWQKFKNTYSPTNGSVRIKSSEATRGILGRWNFNADLSLTDKDGHTCTFNQEITVMGPVSTCTNLLTDVGYCVKVVEFRRFEIFEATATFVYAGHNNDHVWTMGFGQIPEASVLSALVCAANHLHGQCTGDTRVTHE